MRASILRKPADTNPETLAFIRSNAERMSAQAIADHLGWPPDRLRRTVRDRQIELLGLECAPVVSPPKAAPPKPPPPNIAPPLRPATQTFRRGNQSGPLVTINSDTTLPEMADLLPPRQAQMLRVLTLLTENETFIPSRELAELMGCNLNSIGGTAAAINGRLYATRWTIESGQGTSSGYRLIERAKAGRPKIRAFRRDGAS